MALVGFGCSGTKYLQADDRLVASHDIQLKSEEKIPNKTNLKYELQTIARPKPNKKFLVFIPRQRFHEKAKDSTRFLHNIYKLGAEPPAIFDSTLVQASAREMQLYLQESGYYQADVNVALDTSRSKKKIHLTYEVDIQRPYRIDTTIFTSRDTSIQHYLSQIAGRTLLQKDAPVSLNLYKAEVSRITDFLRNNGYNFFQRNFISSLRADSADYRMQLSLEIFPPTDGSVHQQYRIGKIFVQPDYNPTDLTATLKDSLINGIHFILNKEVTQLKPDLLVDKITLTEGEYYQQQKEQQTINNLNGLSSVKFVSVKQEIDPFQSNVINYRILLTRNERYDFSANLEGSYSAMNAQQADNNLPLNLIGAGINLSLSTRRSPLKGGALITNSIQAGIEFDIAELDIFTIDLRLQNQIDIPRFVDYFKLWRTISRGRNRPDGLYRFLEEQVETRVQANINFLRQINLYTYRVLNSSFGYNIRFSENRNRLAINHLGIDYISPSIDSAFQVILDSNPLLRNSFGQQLFTGFLLRDLTYFYNYTNPSREVYSLRVRAEFSGAEVGLVNNLYNRITARNTIFDIANIEFAKYALFEFDARYRKQYTPTRALAIRLNVGVATPYGSTTEVPYVKQFFIGGPNSIRAFRARQLGPGSYCNDELFECNTQRVQARESNSTPFYQTGDLKIEANIEYRFAIAKSGSIQLEGATFLDFGNVWMLKEDPQRPGAAFRFQRDSNAAGHSLKNAPFYRQLAIGTGFGFRLDLSYFLLRLDLGYPLRTPYNHQQVWLRDLYGTDINFNLAIDYPF
ncbi:MAG: BamA/TamA family outer membrane protein [Bacteroidota bacterium]